MDQRLLFEDIKPEIDESFIKNGWVTIYRNTDTQDFTERGGVFCCLGNKDKIAEILAKHGWDISMGRGRPGFVFYHENGEEKADYYRIDGDLVEPFLHYRCDFGNKPSYFEVSEEFRLYYNLFEEYINLHEKNYIHANDSGDDEIVVKISKNEIVAKLRFIKDYISARKMVFIVFFDYMRFSDKSLTELGWTEKDETTNNSTSVLNHFVRDITSMHINKSKTQSWIMGKSIIEGLSNYKPKLFGSNMDEDDGKFADFIIGYDKEGQILSSTCNEDALNNLFGKNPDAPLTLSPVYFSREVLKKYYDNPQKYSVEDGQVKCKGFWSLQIDNSAPDYVVVFLGDLGRIGYKEQLYWKHFNISEGKGLSSTAYKRAILGECADPDSPDLFFKMKYEQFNKEWLLHFGWPFFKPLVQADSHYLTSFHLLTSENNEKEFDEQILCLTKIIIDSLNEKEISRNITLEEGDKGLTKLDKYLKTHECNLPDMLLFLRNLQALRSTTVAHRRSEKNKQAVEAIEYFQIGTKSLKDVLEDIIVKSIWIFNTLEQKLLKKD